MLILLDILTLISLLLGLLFMFVGAVGLWRLPDLYNRMHASSKCITLGISGMLLAAIFHLTAVRLGEPPGGPGATAVGVSAIGAIAKAMLVIIFQFVATPVGAHMLARAAHLDQIELWEGTLSDELDEDNAAPTDRRPGGVRSRRRPAPSAPPPSPPAVEGQSTGE